MIIFDQKQRCECQSAIVTLFCLFVAWQICLKSV